MEDINRNTRTLIVSFALALMVMVPLRFVEVGQTVVGDNSVQVLGDSIETSSPKLEAPYDELDEVLECLSADYVGQVVSFLDPVNDFEEIENFESRICQ